MRPSLKAALLSGLVFPGAGQISLHRYGRGIILVALVIGALACIIVMGARTALALLEQLEMQGGDVDIATLSRLAAQASTLSNAWYYGSLILIVSCWLFGIIDAYRIGKGDADHAR